MSEILSRIHRDGRLAGILDRFDGLSFSGKMSAILASVGIINTTANGLAAVADIANPYTEYVASGSGIIALVGVYGTIRDARKLRTMRAPSGNLEVKSLDAAEITRLIEDRVFSEKDGFHPSYSYADEDAVTHEAPFPVAVSGINEEILGAGRLIGQTEFDEPVIAIEDPKSPNGTIELLGSECYWLPMDDEFAKELASGKGQEITTPAHVYLAGLAES